MLYYFTSGSGSTSSSVSYSIGIDFKGKTIYDEKNKERKMIEVGMVEPLTLWYGLFSSSWGESSRIYFYYTSAKVTLYNDGAPINFGGWLYKGEIGELTVKANAASAGWDDINISVTGIPSPGFGSYNSPELYLTAYKIEVEVQKKWLEGEWEEPSVNNRGTIGGRKWYVLCDCHKNRIRPKMEPKVMESAVGGISWSEIATEEQNPSDPLDLWHNITSTKGVFMDVVPTVTFKGGGEIIGTIKTDIVVTGVADVDWVVQDNPKPLSPVMDLANLAKIDISFPHGGYRIYPEKNDPDSPIFNVAVIAVSLTQEIPKGMSADLHCYVVDNKNPRIGAVITVGLNTGEGEGVGMTLSAKTLTFAYDNLWPTNNISRSFLGKVDKANAGNDFIVVAHPESDLETYLVVNEVGKEFVAMVGSTPLAPDRPLRYQTRLLTVWRTLNVECNMMNYYTYPYGRRPDDENGTYQPPNPADYMGGFVKTELERACVSLNMIGQGATDPSFAGHRPMEDWQLVKLISGVKNVNGRDITENADVTGHAKEFWTLHIIMASSDRPRNPGEVNFGSTSLETNTIVIFFERLKEKHYYTSAINTSIQQTILHEIGHLLGLADKEGGGDVMRGPIKDPNDKLHPTYQKFLPSNIHIIQRRSKVATSKNEVE